MKHSLSCPAYGNYQPPYEDCTCGADWSVFEKITVAKDACYEYAQERRTPGAVILYHAVWHLWNRTEAGAL